jgi:hypothetical protein
MLYPAGGPNSIPCLVGAAENSMMDLCIRYGVFVLVLACTLVTGVVSALDTDGPFWLLILVPLSLLGIWDFLQPRHTLLRNYPLVSHARWIFETARPYLRQYIVEGDLSGAPSTANSARWFTSVPRIRWIPSRSAPISTYTTISTNR